MVNSSSLLNGLRYQVNHIERNRYKQAYDTTETSSCEWTKKISLRNNKREQILNELELIISIHQMIKGNRKRIQTRIQMINVDESFHLLTPNSIIFFCGCSPQTLERFGKGEMVSKWQKRPVFIG